MEPVTLSREVLDWAAHKAGLTLQSFAESVAKRESDVNRISNGKLTSSQAAKLAKKARIPFGYLFLDEPPEITRPVIPDLRQVQEAVPLSEDFHEVLQDVVAKQQWYIEYLKDSGDAALPFVGKFSAVATRKPASVVEDMRKVLQLTDKDRSSSQDSSAYFSRLALKAERVGVLVIKTSFVKAATKRSLSEKEFRGFALAHPVAPIVFVNGKDAEVAAVFTLMHELAHIWLGVSGVSDIALKTSNAIERICNAVAAELLVPADDFKDKWGGPQDLYRLAAYYRVSRTVIARRALDYGFVDQAFYDQVARETRPIKKTGPPSPLVTIPVRNSKRFTRTVVSEAMSGNILLRDAAGLLNVRPDTVMLLARGKVKGG
ncbi:MAG: ImmA/IrrE family metallo-endopeptidase [Xanthomonadales bacterium]|nr:ImmA/IrrE family metallo-endopeptidase [Xanthomonadales bacterium]